MKRNIWFLMALAMALWGCSPTRYRQSADDETYRIIKEKQEAVFGKAEADFTIEKKPLPEFIRGLEHGEETKGAATTERIPAELSDETIKILTKEELTGLQKLLFAELTDEVIERVEDRDLAALLKLSYEETARITFPPPPGAVKLTLVQAVELAVANSREFQSEKESLFLRALALTYQRHLWRPQLGLKGSVTGQKQGDEESIGGKSDFSFGQAIASGARLVLNLGTSFAEFFTGDRRRAVSSLLSLGFSQPLLRGGGRLVAMEGLTQAERGVVYDVRSFARFRKDFSVTVADRYYRVLQGRDTLINNFRNYISLRREWIRNEEMQNKGQATMLDVYEAKQHELSAKNSWISARQDYVDQLDRFKIDPLGLPTEAPIVLDEKELVVLKDTAAAGLLPEEVTLEEAVERALANRFDLMNAEDALEDSERAVAIARDALRAGVDISFSTSAETEPPTKAIKFQFNEASYSAGLSFDLPIDRKQERNAYRQALIALESQKRSLSLLKDNIKLQVRQAYRNLEQARKSYEIQKMSVELAVTRVDNATMEHELGRATTRDVLLAKESLINAQNALTSALVRHEIAKLQLLLSTEELRVDERGLWLGEKQSARGDENVKRTEPSGPEKQEPSKS